MNINNQKKFELRVTKLVNQYNVGNYGHVIRECNLLLKKNPKNIFIYNLLGNCFQKINELEQAKEIFLYILKLESGNIVAMNNLANTFRSLKKFDDAEKYYKKILAINPKYIHGLVNYGTLNFELDRFERAIELYDQALEIDKNNLLLYYNYALSHQSLGNFKEAEILFKEVLRINPKVTSADKFISRTIKYTKDNSHLVEMEKKSKDNSLNDFEKANLFFALGKAYEDLLDYQKSFYYLKKGNDIQKKITKYDSNIDDKLFEDLMKYFENYDFKKINKTNNDDKSIIFILGMPRSGTSLVEQIISSHSKVYGAGESDFLETLILKNFYKNDIFNSKKINNENSKKEFTNIASNYYKLMEPFQAKENLITDKTPSNFRWIGFIKILFPNAKIIHCTRDPKDNCLSLYKNIFDQNLNFSYDQSDLSKYYLNYFGLMKFWDKKIPNFIYNINYENLISNSTIEIKNLIKFCELDWEENCLKFYNNKRAIKTVSAAQARQQLYKSSIASNKNYESYLSDLFSNLEKLYH